MKERDYFEALGELPGSRKNAIIHAVNSKIPKKEAGLKTDVEKVFYDRLVAEANALEKRGGVRPVFEMCEIESDDPCLDIYND